MVSFVQGGEMGESSGKSEQHNPVALLACQDSLESGRGGRKVGKKVKGREELGRSEGGA